ncbi:MAG TPA: efflux RND transporter periplasmic adaptor subunit [Acidobacteriaceae bacterium]
MGNEICIQRLGLKSGPAVSFFTKCSPRWSLWLAGPLLCVLAGCKSTDVKTKEALPPVPVTIAQATVRDVPVRLQAIGSVQAISTVSIRALVSGELKTVNFHQGDEVHKGQVLFTIDPQPYEAALAQAEANLARDMATAKQALSQAQRYADLAQQGIVSTEQNEQIQATSGANGALVRSDRAAVDTAKLNLSYCTIVAPLDGRTGNLLIQPGNLVQPNTTVLVTINQIAPIYVSLSVPEQYRLQLKEADRSGATTVTAQAQGDPQMESGKLSFINNAIDNSTGTIQLMATFPNSKERLWPGEYVNTEIVLSTLNHATVVPSTAILTGQNEKYVYVLMPDQTVQARDVKTSITAGDITVLTSGISPGEKVVTDGQVSLSPGAKVLLRQAGNTMPPTGTGQSQAGQ